MINLLNVMGLLFSFSPGNTLTLHEQTLTNSNHWTRFACYKKANSIYTRESDPTYIRVGAFTENSTQYQFYSVLQINIPQLNSSSIDSAALELFSYSVSGTLNVSYRLSYDFGSNPGNYSWTSIGAALFQGQKYNLSLTSLMPTFLQSNQKNIYLLLEAASQYSSIKLGGNANSESYRPTFTILSTQLPSPNHYGNAFSYTPVNDFYETSPDNVFNCYGYAIGEKGYARLSTLNYLLSGFSFDDTNVASTAIPLIANNLANVFNLTLGFKPKI